MSHRMLPVRVLARLSEPVVLTAASTKLHLIWREHRTIISAPEVFYVSDTCLLLRLEARDDWGRTFRPIFGLYYPP